MQRRTRGGCACIACGGSSHPCVHRVVSESDKLRVLELGAMGARWKLTYNTAFAYIPGLRGQEPEQFELTAYGQPPQYVIGGTTLDTRASPAGQNVGTEPDQEAEPDEEEHPQVHGTTVASTSSPAAQPDEDAEQDAVPVVFPQGAALFRRLLKQAILKDLGGEAAAVSRRPYLRSRFIENL